MVGDVVDAGGVDKGMKSEVGAVDEGFGMIGGVIVDVLSLSATVRR